MATYLDSYYSKLKSSTQNIESDILSLLVDREAEIRELIKSRWKLGKRPDGDIIGLYRDSSYQIFKSNMNSLSGGTVDLILSGDLVNRIKIVLQSKGIEIISTDSKFDEISTKYGIDNFNITEGEEKEMLDEIMKEVVNNIMSRVWQ